MQDKTVRRRIAKPLTGLLAALLLASGAGIASADETPDPNLEQTVAPDEVVGDVLAEVETGHIDIGPKLIDGAWTLMARDDTATPPVWRMTEDLVLRVNDAALLTFPEDPQFDFVDVPAGEQVHVIPQTQNTSSIWLGWNTQDPSVVPLLPNGAELVLHGAEGPGEVHLFLSNGFDPPTQLWDTATLAADGEQPLWMQTNTHVHANWVFTEPGVYLLDAEVRAESGDGEQLSAHGTLLFAVGDATATSDVVAALDDRRAAPEATAPSSGAASTAAAAGSDATPSVSSDEAAPEPDGDVVAEPGRSDDTMALVAGVAAGVVIVLLGLGAWFIARRNARLRDSVESESANTSEEGVK